MRYLDAGKLKARWASIHSGPDWPLPGANALGNKVRYAPDLVKAREQAKARDIILCILAEKWQMAARQMAHLPKAGCKPGIGAKVFLLPMICVAITAKIVCGNFIF